MLKKTITYEDYNGKERTEDFYFHLSKPAVINLEYSVPGGLSNFVDRAVKRGDEKDLLDLINIFITKSYGQKSDDGKRFIQNDEVLQAFLESPAYEEFLFETLSSSKSATEFINGIMPKDLEKMLAEMSEEDQKALLEKNKQPRPKKSK